MVPSRRFRLTVANAHLDGGVCYATVRFPPYSLSVSMSLSCVGCCWKAVCCYAAVRFPPYSFPVGFCDLCCCV